MNNLKLKEYFPGPGDPETWGGVRPDGDEPIRKNKIKKSEDDIDSYDVDKPQSKSIQTNKSVWSNDEGIAPNGKKYNSSNTIYGIDEFTIKKQIKKNCDYERGAKIPVFNGIEDWNRDSNNIQIEKSDDQSFPFKATVYYWDRHKSGFENPGDPVQEKLFEHVKGNIFKLI